MCTVLLPPGVDPIAANKYMNINIIYHIISYHNHIICNYVPVESNTQCLEKRYYRNPQGRLGVK